MIPRLNVQAPMTPTCTQFLDALQAAGFSGDIRSDFSSRLVTATDNSIYQVLPQAVLLPRSEADIALIFKLAQQSEYQNLSFSPRGGGTGTNGQALTQGMVVDCSKYMRGVLEVNTQEKWVRVQPGVILDQLNDVLKAEGLFFAPNLSPSNRATLGGMINTDACGIGSRVYGRTSNHVMEMKVVLTDGSCCHFRSMSKDELSKTKAQSDMEGLVYQLVDEIVSENKELIEAQFPKMSRFLTGYNLAHVYDEQGHFNLGELICGSEGSLAIVSEAKLSLTEIPQYKKMMAVKYRSFNDALGDAQALLAIEPTAIETVDEKILEAARGDEIWHEVQPLLGDDPTMKTVNLVELTAYDEAELDKKVALFSERAEESKAMGFHATAEPKQIAALWRLRKKGVGLLGNLPGARRPIAFIEDTAVPPEHLADYIRDLRALLEHHNLQFAMYGHVDVGCLHLRPSLNMQDPMDEKLVRVLSDEVVALVQKYGGVMWAEHGKGFRSEYTEAFFGPELYQQLRRIKGVFDPRNILNPGKVVIPEGLDDPLVQIEAPLRGHFDRQIPEDLQVPFKETINCNGNGVCFNYHPHQVICPSSKITKDRIHSPKGRATVFREWLRQLSQAASGAPTVAYEHSLKPQGQHTALKSMKQKGRFVTRLQNSLKKEDDYSHEVLAAMRGCLSCKACTTQCPIHVDISHFKAHFLDAYHTRYLRPPKDHLIGQLETTLPLQGLMPRVINFFTGSSLMKGLIAKTVGLVDAPQLSVPTVNTELKRRGKGSGGNLLLVQDAFTSYYDAAVFWATHDLLETLGYQVEVLPYVANGKPLHIKGFLKEFEAVARKNAAFLEDAAKRNLPMVAVEPSIALTYRDEYPKILGRSMNFEVQLLQEFLVGQTEQLQKKAFKQNQKFGLLSHCMEKTGAPDADQQWQQVFTALGLDLKVLPTGCCGMAGTFGHETGNLEESKGIFQMSWGLYFEGEPTEREMLVTGYSCRTQVKRFAKQQLRHPAQALMRMLEQSP